VSWGGRVLRTASWFHSLRAISSAEVSNDCGSSPGSGTLWTRVPCGIGVSSS